MTKPLLIKKSFNGGELSPELHYRDDLAAYAKGCKHLDNMQATPYGAVTRRPPMELMARIDTDLYGIPVKYIPFKFSLTEVFNIVFTDGSGSESPDSSTADFMVFDDDGNLVILEGTDSELTVLPATLPAILASGFTALANTIYDPADLGDLHFINVNDFVYLTCGGNYPVQRINRFFNEDDNANRWRIEEVDFKGGAMEDVNTNEGWTVETNILEYVGGDSYSDGEIVSGKSVAGKSHFQPGAWSNLGGGMYRWVHYINNHGLEAGDNFVMEGGSASGGSGAFFAGTNTPFAGDLSGEYQVSKRNSANEFSGGPLLEVNAGGSTPSVTQGGALIWKSTDYNTLYRSLKDNNTDPLNDTSSWAEVDRTSQEVDVTASESIFKATDVGRLLQLDVENELGTQGDWTNNQVSFPIIPGARVILTTEGGAWGGRLTLQESKTEGETWVDIGHIESIDGSNNGSIERDVSDVNTLIRVKLSGYVQPSTSYPKDGCVWRLETPDGASEFFKITDYVDGQNVRVKPITPIAQKNKTSRWSLGAWSETSGYPLTLTINDERLCLGGSRSNPNTVYASKVNDWENFLRGTQETSPYTFTVASDSFDTIRSLKSSRQLNILTDNQEATMGSREDNAVTSVSNIAVSSHTNYGSSKVQAVQMADMIWFSMGQAQRVRASRYDFASDGQQSIEMSLFANHITESGIKEMSFRRHPFNTLFCVLNDGTACSLTYEGAQDVQAWSTITTDGNIISAYANYSDKGDIVNGIVEREGFYYLERFGSNDESTIYLDNFVTYVDKDFTLGVTLEQGFTDDLVVIDCQDRQLVEGVDYTIIGGVLTIPNATCNTVTVGIPFTSRVNPTDVTEYAPDGALRRLSALALYLLDSGDCEVKINGKDSNFTAGSRLLPTERLDGRHEMTTGGGYDSGCDVDIYVRDHKPFTLIGLGYRMSANQ